MLWQPALLPQLIGFDAVPASAGDVVDLTGLGAAIIEYDIAGEGRVVELRDGPHRLWLALGGGEIWQGPILPRFRIEGLGGLSAQLRTLARFLELVRSGRFRVAQFGRQKRAARWALCLRAYDAWTAGASRRELAVALYGEAAVWAEWKGRSDYMVSRVRRMVAEGRRLVAGGYRGLVLFD